jgi:ABC-type phosphate/phosphonate transport system permease subunit
MLKQQSSTILECHLEEFYLFAEKITARSREETGCDLRLGYAKKTFLNEMFPTTLDRVRPKSEKALITTLRSAVFITFMAAFLALESAVSAGSTCPRPCAPILPMHN